MVFHRLFIHFSGDAPNVANAALTAVAHGRNPQDRAASPVAQN
ncbi:hypothetical protein [Nostoc sp. ChiVER01]|nr:hypothetical protein [Nostoc sp. ChiVER01]MDZ8224073.1 hypothetical protein [Nostoc sp. ChiVER01]